MVLDMAKIEKPQEMVWFLCLMAYQLFLGYLMRETILLEEQ